MSRLEATAAAAAVTYIDRTQVGKRPPLSPPAREAAGTTMAIDPATRANLELTRTLAGERRGSLLDAIDCTVTAAGSRLLAQRLAAPLDRQRRDRAAARCGRRLRRRQRRARRHPRHRCAPHPTCRARWRGFRWDAAARAILPACATASSPPTGAGAARELEQPPQEIAAVMAALRRPSRELAREFERALAEQLPLIKRDGGFVREGYEAALDEARTLRDASRLVVAAMQARYADDDRRQRPEDPAQQRARLFRRGHRAARRQADGAAAERDLHPSPDAGRPGPFTTAELGEIEAKIANAGERALGLELEIFDRLCATVAAARTINATPRTRLPLLDVAAALANLAVDDNYVRPEVDGSLGFAIEGGRHPVVEQALKRDGEPFIANACDLSPDQRQTSGQIWLITGPNMAGKSTFLRQNALIALIAQIGSFVPARGRASALSTGCSLASAPPTIWRAAAPPSWWRWSRPPPILNQASERSLVILDEIGRGTATFDGLSIAWAAIEHLHESQSLPRAVRHALPRADRALRKAAAAVQRDRAGEGMAGRRGVPA